MAIKIADIVVQLLTENPSLTNDQVAEEIQRRVPGANTSAASVASMKSGARKAGLLAPSGSNHNALMASTALTGPDPLEPAETPEERSDRIRRRYNTLERMAYQVAEGNLPSLIVSGPPGLGKSFTVEKVLEEVRGEATSEVVDEEDFKPYDIISGTISAVGLYIALWNQRDGGVVVLDDCDAAFHDETCLNLLKAVLDSSPKRWVSYRKKAQWMEEMNIPSSFAFEGSVVFCTNIDFETAIAKGSNLGAHFSALIDRSLYLSLTMRTTEDFITRIRHVAIEDGMLERNGLDADQANEIMDYIVENASSFYSLSIRLAHQIAICYKMGKATWKDDVEATKMRTWARKSRH